MSILLVLAPFMVSMLLVFWIHPKVVRIAKEKDIVDNPNARKLQKEPVPILGGVAVFFGLVSAIGGMSLFVNTSSLFPIVIAMMVTLYTGVIDDILGLSPKLRFVIEIVVIIFLIGLTSFSVNCFHGLWGVYELTRWISIPLTVVACVGIINAINLVDGVNGLSSGFGIMSCSIFCIWFFVAGNATMAILAAATTGALVPFFLHNVFGKKSRMFIGDGGALTLGLVLSIFVIATLRSDTSCNFIAEKGVGLIPFTIAVLAVPVFDTLRVMITRILQRKSPFHPDKTHLHHIIVSLGCSHLVTTVVELTLNTIVVFAWLGSVLLGASVDVQLYIVLGLALIATLGLYRYLSYHSKNKTRIFHRLEDFFHNGYFCRNLRRHLRIRKWVDRM